MSAPGAACLHVNVGVICLTVFCEQQQQVVLCSCKPLFCLLSLRMYLATYLFLLLFCGQPMETMGFSLSLTHTHTLTHRWVQCLQDDISAFQTYYTQTISSTVYTAHLHGALKSNRSQDMCMVHGLQLQLLFFFIKACQNSVSTSSNDFSSSSDVCFYRMRRSLSRR